MLVIREVVSPTVENRAAMGVFLPTVLKRFALQYLLMSCVTSKYPKAPAQTHSGSHSYYCVYYMECACSQLLANTNYMVHIGNESTAGADASVEALKLYDMIYIGAKSGK